MRTLGTLTDREASCMHAPAILVFFRASYPGKSNIGMTLKQREPGDSGDSKAEMIGALGILGIPQLYGTKRP